MNAGGGPARTDGVTPVVCFSYECPVWFDDMDALGTVHHGRFPYLAERAQSALFESLGYGWTDVRDRHEDICYVVREVRVGYHAPVTTPGDVRVDLSVEHVGTTSAVWGFRCSTVDPDTGRETLHASGERVVVKVDPDTLRPRPWTDAFRALLARLRAGQPPSERTAP
ncbi:MAG: thioesterase family protein [Candidatus Nanopelagicales bacterium]